MSNKISLGSICKIGFLVLDEFTMVSLAGAIDVLRVVNQLAEQPNYQWSVLTVDGQPVSSSSGLAPVHVTDYDTIGRLDLVLVCGGAHLTMHVDDALVALLRRMARDDVVLGGICTGTYALVKSGLLDGYRCAIHWENLASLRELFCNVDFVDDLFVIDRDRVTCTGGIAPIDMILALVRARCGDKVVADISDHFILERVRDCQERQRAPLAAQLGFSHRALEEVAQLMESHFEQPLSVPELAELSGMSVRRIQRIFQDSLGMTPTQYYLQLRLRRARELLLRSNMSITEISLLCGFQSVGHFSTVYRTAHGRTPTSERSRSRSEAGALLSARSGID